MGERFNLTAQLQLQAPTNTRQVISQIRSQLQGVNVDVRVQANTRTLTQVNRSLADINGSARNAATSFGFLNRNLSEAARRFGVITLATGTMLSFAQSVKRAVGDAIAFERQMVTLSQVTGNTVKQLEGVSQEVTRLSVSLGASSKELLSVAVTLAQAGFSADETRKSLDILAKTTLGPSFEDVTETVEGAIAAVRQFSEEAAAAGGTVKFLEATLDSINSVSKAFAVESSDLITVIRRTGGVFAAAGGSVNELIALFTSVRATTRESAETIATGLRTIFTRIQRTETVQQLESLGIALRDAEGKFVGAFEAVRRLSVGLSALDPRDVRFSAIVEELGGFRQIGKVIPLIQQFAVAQDALNVAQAASGSVAQDAVTAQQALAVQAQKVSEQFSALIRQLANSSTFREIASGALELASALIKIASALEPVLPLLTSFLALKVGQGLAPGLTALLGFGGARRRASGGVIRKYARGGFVPGTGNRDTVPAMLQPGEFVIRKSSVNKIGAANLAAMNENGYALGGEVAVGAAIPDLVNNGNTIQGSVTVPVVPSIRGKGREATGVADTVLGAKTGFGALTNTSMYDLFGLKAQSSVTKNTPQGKIPAKDLADIATSVIGGSSKTYQTVTSGVSSAQKDAFNNILNTELQNAIKNGASRWASSVGVGISTSEISFADNFELPSGFAGSYFESILDAFNGRPIGAESSESKRPFDFTQGLTGAANEKLFSALSNLNYIDAKISQAAIPPSEYNKKVKNQLALESFDEIRNRSLQKYQNLLRSAPQEQAVKKNLGGLIQRFAKGSSGKGVESGKGILPRPGSAIASVIKAGGGFVDIDRTLLRTVGDIAYGKARTDSERDAVLKKYFLDPAQRLKDIRSAGLTQFGKELQSSIKSGKLDGRKVKVVSKSTEVQGLRQYLSGLFGIPSGNMTFTAGSSKVPFIRGKGPLVDDIPDNARFASGGGVGTDTVPALLTPGEFVINKKSAQSIGYGSLNRMNKVGKYAKGGAVGVQNFANGGIAQTAQSLDQALGVAQQFVFLGSAVAAVTASMSGLSSVQQQAITETAGFVTGIVGIVGTVGQLITSIVTATTASAAEAASSTAAATADGAEAVASGAATAATSAFSFALLAGVAAIVAVVASYKYQAATARAQANELKKASDMQIEALSNLSGSTEEFIKTQQEQIKKEEAAVISDTAATSGSTIGAGVAGATFVGAIATGIGVALAPFLAPLLGIPALLIAGIAGVAGVATGAGVGTQLGGELNKQAEAERQAKVAAKFNAELEKSSRLLAETTQTQAQFKQSLQDIDIEKNLTPETRVQRRLQAQSGVTNFASGNIAASNRQLQALATEKGKGVGELTEADFSQDPRLKTIFLNAQKTLAKNLELLSQSVAESRQTLEEAAKVEITGDQSFAEIIASGGQLAKAFAMSQAAINAETTARVATLQAQLAGAKDDKTKADLQKAINAETERGTLRLRDQRQALEAQAEEQKKLKAELIATAAANAAFRQRMLEINAIADGLVNVDNALNKLEKSASNLSSLLSGDKLDFSLDAPEGLDNLENVGDVGTFNKGIDAIAASMGAAGPKLAASTKQSVDIIQRMNRSQIIGKQFQTTEAAPTADQFLAEMGLKQADLGNEIYQEFKKKFGKLSEDQIISPEDAQELFNPILEEGRRSAALLNKYNDQQSRAISIYQSFVSQLKNQTDKEIESRQKLVSLVAKTEELRAKARNQELTSAQKQAFRQQEAQIPLTGLRDLAGNQLQAGNVEQLSATRAAAFAERASIEADIKAGKVTADRAKREIELNNIIEKTSTELDRLTDQGERAADILGELDKERQNKKVGKDLVEDFVVGGAKERTAINQAFAGVQKAIQTGTIQNQTPEQRKATFDLLDKLKDVAAFNVGGVQYTGAQVKDEIVRRDAVQLGFDPKVLNALYGETDKEKELINALDRLTLEIRQAGGANVAFEQQKTEAARQRAGQAAIDLSATGTARIGQPPLPPAPPGQPAAGPQQQFAAGAAVAGGRAAVQQAEQPIRPPLVPAGGLPIPRAAGAAPPAGAGAAPPAGAGAGLPQNRAEMLAQRAAQAEQVKQDRKKKAIEDKEARKAAFAQTPLGKATAELKAKKYDRRANENATARAKGKQVALTPLTPDDLAIRQQLIAQLMGQQDITSASGLSSVATTPPATPPAPQLATAPPIPTPTIPQVATTTVAATPAPTTTVATTPTAPTGPIPIDATGLNDVFNTFVGNFSSSLDNIVQRFSGIESAFGSLTQALTGITMTHTVTVEGLISVGGLNLESIKQELSSSIGQMVAQEIKTKMDEEGRRFKI